MTPGRWKPNTGTPCGPARRCSPPTSGTESPSLTAQTRTGAYQRTALVTARYHGGEPWGDGDNRAFPVFGPAAAGEEHPGVMSHLAEVLDDEEQRARLAVATDQDFVRKTLAAPPE